MIDMNIICILYASDGTWALYRKVIKSLASYKLASTHVPSQLVWCRVIRHIPFVKLQTTGNKLVVSYSKVSLLTVMLIVAGWKLFRATKLYPLSDRVKFKISILTEIVCSRVQVSQTCSNPIDLCIPELQQHKNWRTGQKLNHQLSLILSGCSLCENPPANIVHQVLLLNF